MVDSSSLITGDYVFPRLVFVFLNNIQDFRLTQSQYVCSFRIQTLRIIK